MKDELKQLIERFEKLGLVRHHVAIMVHDKYPDDISVRHANRILKGEVTGQGTRPCERLKYVEKIIKEIENETK
ncbi:MAG: hypothetical protein Unbinned6284contig1004_37 [Prokaryotic dsDNA virus sp.]|nr:MAG: hypothetical protein Unbinned6284contig1004_37 [Prokaryotic dsDNA virus sp.]|tara:strand:- start:4380 stop:4601 length:222 start_codon:yes stop_codon:yes gene_type:complete